MEHCDSIHNNRRTSPSTTKDINTGPDLYDSNFHCKSSNIEYNGRNEYRY
ncbi:hypothetical protein HMPREF1544_01316 [Mucor circinelloides 1006PhL]|uniref:Uncharacterized protein n=1 Tax=Mucor circinelloides f. circinelloides (strain 1006PhL) TaxID=1220926 RepID=S2K8R6_MUCC1|nr:hypothetical protein HMPREF1544_01316 [Mucor circinelloides 1006PhL]